MSASYPSSVKAFATISNNDIVDASDPNDIQAEVTAIEGGLLNGFAHNVGADADNLYDIGSSAKSFKDLYVKGTTKIHGVQYTWPAADGAAGALLQTDAAGTLSWATTFRTLTPVANNTYDLGSGAAMWQNLYVKGTTKLNGGTYTWPAADGAGTLTSNGAGALSWVAATGGGFKIGTTTRDVSTASGTQAITGVGFQPRVILFLTNLSGQIVWSVGFDNGTNAYCTLGDVTGGSLPAVTAISLAVGVDASNFQKGTVTTLGADGFTITWVKVGTPTGTANIHYLAIQ